MLIKSTRDAIQNCRFCLMCRHTCTVGKFTKNESDTPRGKALNLWTVLEGMRSFTMTDAEIFFGCPDCHRCKEHCISDYDVPGMVEAARRDLVSAGLVPEKVKELRKDILEKGNPFGAEKTIVQEIKSCDILLFPGCEISTNSTELFEPLEKLMNLLGLDFEIFRDVCCGAPLKSLGFYEDAKLIGENLVSKIGRAKAKEVIVFCPNCFIAMTQNFGKLGISFPKNIRVKLFLNFIKEVINQGKLKLKSGAERRILIHDPCSTGRKLQFYDLPREILRSLPGIEPLEFFLNRGESPCCGGSVISRRISPELGTHSTSIIQREVREVGADGVMTTCPTCRVQINRQEGEVRAFDILELLTV